MMRHCSGPQDRACADHPRLLIGFNASVFKLCALDACVHQPCLFFLERCQPLAGRVSANKKATRRWLFSSPKDGLLLGVLRSVGSSTSGAGSSVGGTSSCGGGSGSRGSCSGVGGVCSLSSSSVGGSAGGVSGSTDSSASGRSSSASSGSGFAHGSLGGVSSSVLGSVSGGSRLSRCGSSVLGRSRRCLFLAAGGQGSGCNQCSEYKLVVHLRVLVEKMKVFFGKCLGMAHAGQFRQAEGAF